MSGIRVGLLALNMSGLRGLQKVAVFQLNCSVTTLTAFGWNQYIKTLRLNLNL